MIIYLATFISEEAQGIALTEKKAENRLTSFYFVMVNKLKAKTLREYIKTGRLKPKNK